MPNGFGILAVTNSDEKMYYDHISSGHVVPSPDGKIIFTMTGQRPPEVAQQMMMMPKADDPMLPACHGDYYLNLPPHSKPGTVIIRAASRTAPIATLTDVDLPAFGSRPFGMALPAPAPDRDTVVSDFTLDKRVHLVPSARLLIVIPMSNDRLVLHRFAE